MINTLTINISHNYSGCVRRYFKRSLVCYSSHCLSFLPRDVSAPIETCGALGRAASNSAWRCDIPEVVRTRDVQSSDYQRLRDTENGISVSDQRSQRQQCFFIRVYDYINHLYRYLVDRWFEVWDIPTWIGCERLKTQRRTVVPQQVWPISLIPTRHPSNPGPSPSLTPPSRAVRAGLLSPDAPEDPQLNERRPPQSTSVV